VDSSTLVISTLAMNIKNFALEDQDDIEMSDMERTGASVKNPLIGRG
jgi:hypothetical protein